MDQVRRRWPKAFSLQRDNHLTDGHLSDLTDWTKSRPHLVREQETRHVTAIRSVARGTELMVEDFFGHRQYGIASNRPLSSDYHAGDVVLVADAYQSAKATVLEVFDPKRTVLVSPLAPSPETWKLDYSAPLPDKEQPHWPGLFSNGGCYLYKFSPVGTPKYYWGRVDAEWDRAHRVYGRRFIVSLPDAPGDLAMDRRARTTAKDYVQLHEVMRTIAGTG